ncbi:hypothetical protein PP182_00135 [Maribacter sp. PR1]|uniref:Uncharacterized protein n=1 Tax=Maribacter cobaltidurans TaxID=1178778 RepID=A0ABU7INN9_9FLAO|nr:MULTISPECIES: hypothetical protein [Maribacter]MDC6387072.1 hypothetical protein [Maribacter sp. PR1]MEE1974458.1 hypothetical protein [Maribacter cobaltidurans]
MKNSFKFLLLIAFAIVLTSCQEGPKKEHQTEEVDEIIYEAPKQIISLEDADSLYINYNKRRISNIIESEREYQENDEPFVPTEFVSFDIEILKKYIGYVEQEAKNGGTTADSLRIYFGNYGTKSKKYARKNTVFILPTADVNGEYGGIFIDANGKAKLVRNWVDEQSDQGIKGNQKSEASILPSFSIAPALQGGTSLTLNRGNGGPPPKQDF